MQQRITSPISKEVYPTVANRVEVKISKYSTIASLAGAVGSSKSSCLGKK
jgi:hypothetical protein